MRRRGFTLIEVILAIALLLALSAGMLSYIWGLLASRERLVKATDQEIAAAALFEELEGDLSTTFAVDGAGAAGVEGTGSSLVVRMRGVGALAEGGVSDFGDLQGCEVKFDGTALSARRLAPNAAPFEMLASPVEFVQFRYFDGSTWGSSFNSASTGSLPVAVEASVWFDSGAAAGAGDDTADGSEAGAEREKPARAPDRVRVMVVPDGPVTSWKSHL
jgi:prepilin-type N-terminal cleavage/methylation domain-containing protein